MKPDLHGAIMDCERITNPHSRAQVQTVLMSLAEGCASCEHFRLAGNCYGCNVVPKVEEMKASIIDRANRNPCFQG
jgi:hypothetical protein